MKSIVFIGPIRNDLSGLPYGFWIGIGPRPVEGRFAPIPFMFQFGMCWYPRWKIAAGDRALAPILPRFSLEFA